MRLQTRFEFVKNLMIVLGKLLDDGLMVVHSFWQLGQAIAPDLVRGLPEMVERMKAAENAEDLFPRDVVKFRG